MNAYSDSGVTLLVRADGITVVTSPVLPYPVECLSLDEAAGALRALAIVSGIEAHRRAWAWAKAEQWEVERRSAR